MKKTVLILLTSLLALTACKNNKDNSDAEAAVADASHDELVAAVSERDQLLELVNQINADMDSIRQIENILKVTPEGELNDQRAQLRANMDALQQTLRERRERLAQLEERLNNSSLSNANLRQTVESLRAQIDAQTEEIGTLRQNLDQARAQIGALDQAVDSLNRTVGTVEAQRDSSRNEALRIENELNTCFYAIGTRDELREYNIIETGFLRRTKLMEGDFNQNFFTRADKRSLPYIDLNSTRARVLTNQPSDSYRIIDRNGHKVLEIINPTLFWSLSNYLVVQID